MRSTEETTVPPGGSTGQRCPLCTTEYACPVGAKMLGDLITGAGSFSDVCEHFTGVRPVSVERTS